MATVPTKATKLRKKLTPAALPDRTSQPTLAAMRATAKAAAAADGSDAEDRVYEPDEEVTVIVPKPFPFTHDDHRIQQISAGTQSMTFTMADHWFCKAMGVTIYDSTTH